MTRTTTLTLALVKTRGLILYTSRPMVLLKKLHDGLRNSTLAYSDGFKVKSAYEPRAHQARAHFRFERSKNISTPLWIGC